MSAQWLNLSGITYRHRWAAQAIKVELQAHTQILLKFLHRKLFPKPKKLMEGYISQEIFIYFFINCD